jgi:hypothetical protein
MIPGKSGIKWRIFLCRDEIIEIATHHQNME